MLRTSHLRHFALLFGSSLALTLALFGELGNWSIALGAPSLCAEPTGAGGCFTTIAAAMTAAASGNTISIHAGIYNENVDVGSKSLTFKGDGRSATIVDGGNNGRVFQVSNGYNLALYDLTVRNGKSSSNGGRIYMGGGTNLLTLINVDVLSNTAGAKGGGAGGGLAQNGSLTIRKTQPIAAATTYYFGLAGKYAGSDLEVAAAVPSTLTSPQVDRFDAAPANPPAGQTTPIYWAITPVGSGYTVNLTQPHDGVSTPSACRRVSGSVWDCAQSAYDASTVTRSGVTQFSDWAVFPEQQPLATVTTVTSRPSTTVFGEPMVFTATLDSANSGGTVQFYAGGAALGSAQQIEGGTAVFTSSALAAGSYAISATSTITTQGYLNSDGTLSGLQVVNKANSTMTVTSSANPSLFGPSTTFTATVSLAVPGSPVSGTVDFKLDGAPVYTDTLADGHLAYTTAALAVGSHTVAADYLGTANLNGSSAASAAANW